MALRSRAITAINYALANPFGPYGPNYGVSNAINTGNSIQTALFWRLPLIDERFTAFVGSGDSGGNALTASDNAEGALTDYTRERYVYSSVLVSPCPEHPMYIVRNPTDPRWLDKKEMIEQATHYFNPAKMDYKKELDMLLLSGTGDASVPPLQISKLATKLSKKIALTGTFIPDTGHTMATEYHRTTFSSWLQRLLDQRQLNKIKNYQLHHTPGSGEISVNIEVIGNINTIESVKFCYISSNNKNFLASPLSSHYTPYDNYSHTAVPPELPPYQYRCEVMALASSSQTIKRAIYSKKVANISKQYLAGFVLVQDRVNGLTGYVSSIMKHINLY